MTSEGKSVAASYAMDCISRADMAGQGLPPDPALEVAKAQVYATLALVETLERLEANGEPPVFGRD
jgi:hypothetical protein